MRNSKFYKNIARALRILATTLGWVLLATLPASNLMQTVEYEKAIDDLKVGVVLPLSGDNSSFGKEILEGMESALSPLSREKLKLKREHYSLFSKVKLMVRDHGGDIEKGKELAHELYADHRATFVVGGLSTLESQGYAEISSQRAGLFISLLPRTLEGLGDYSRAISFSSSYSWQLKLIAEHLGTSFPDLLPEKMMIVTSESILAPRELTTHQKFTDFFDSLSSTPDQTDPKQVHSGWWQQVMSVDDMRNQHSHMEQDLFVMIAKKILASNPAILVITLGLHQSKRLLTALKSLGFTGSIYGLDYWDHPAFRNHQLAQNIHYVVQYDPSFFTDDFQEIFYFHNQSKPTVLSALGYDVILFILSLFQQAKSTRIPPFLRLIEGEKVIHAPASFDETYRRGPDHFLERKMILRSFKPRSYQVIGDVTKSDNNP